MGFLCCSLSVNHSVTQTSTVATKQTDSGIGVMQSTNVLKSPVSVVDDTGVSVRQCSLVNPHD